MDDKQTNVTPSGQGPTDTGGVGLPPLPETPVTPPAPPSVPVTPPVSPAPPTPPLPPALSAPEPKREEPKVPEKLGPKTKISRKVAIGGLVVAILAVAVVGISALFPQFTGELRRKAYGDTCTGGGKVCHYNQCSSGYTSVAGTCTGANLVCCQPAATATPTATGGCDAFTSDLPCIGSSPGDPCGAYPDYRCQRDPGESSCSCNPPAAAPSPAPATCPHGPGDTCDPPGTDCVASCSSCPYGTIQGGIGSGTYTRCRTAAEAGVTPPQNVSCASGTCVTAYGCTAGYNQVGTCVSGGVSGVCCVAAATATATPTPTATCTGGGKVCHYTQCSSGYTPATGTCTGTNLVCCKPVAATATQRPDSCGTGSTCVSLSGTACFNAGGDPDSCTNSSGNSGTCCRPTTTPTPTPTRTPTSRPTTPTVPPIGGACGGLNQPCCAPENVGAGSICNTGFYCHTELGYKCTADPNVCSTGQPAGGQCQVYKCGSRCDLGNQCTIADGGPVSCASASLGGQCGQIDYLDTSGAYCGVKVQHCYGSCAGPTPPPPTTAPPTSVPPTTGAAGCPYNSTQGQVHKSDADPWADSVTVQAGQSFIVGGFHNGTGQPAYDVTYQVLRGSTVLATRNATNANDWAYTYTVPANQSAGTLTVKTTTRGYSGDAKCEDTATVTIGTVTADACVETRVYLKNLEGRFETTATPVNQLAAKVKVGDVIRLAVRGNKATFVGGRFNVKINDGPVAVYEVTSSLPLPGDPATKEYYYDYTIPQAGSYSVEAAVSFTAPTVTATPSIITSTPSVAPTLTPPWTGYPLPADRIDAASQYRQPDGLIRTNVFRDNRYWGYVCNVGSSPVTCRAVITNTIGQGIQGSYAVAFPTDRIDSISQYMQPNGVLRTNVFKGNRYWGYTCTFQAGTSTIASCNAVTTGTLSEFGTGITGTFTTAMPIDGFDAVDQYIEPNGRLRTNVFRGNRYWGFNCGFNTGGATVNTCTVVATRTLTEWASGLQFDPPLPTDAIDAFSQYYQVDGRLRVNAFRGARYWGYTCTYQPGTATVTSCVAAASVPLSNWAALLQNEGILGVSTTQPLTENRGNILKQLFGRLFKINN